MRYDGRETDGGHGFQMHVGPMRGAIDGLRVVDASIMLRIVIGSLNTSKIMIAEKITDAIRGREPLPPSISSTRPRAAPVR